MFACLLPGKGVNIAQVFSMNFPSSFQIVFNFATSLSPWISTGFWTLVVDEPVSLDEGHLIQSKAWNVYVVIRGFFTFAG